MRLRGLEKAPSARRPRDTAGEQEHLADEPCGPGVDDDPCLEMNDPVSGQVESRRSPNAQGVQLEHQRQQDGDGQSQQHQGFLGMPAFGMAVRIRKVLPTARFRT